MEYVNILVQTRSSLATITLNRPQALNALNAATLDELDIAFEDLGADPSIRVILVTGAGDRAFAAGADIREIAALGPEDGRAFALRGQRVFRRIESLPKPVIACIRGFALGGGCELALACHLRLAAEDARIGLPEVKLGLVPGYGGTQRLPRLIGRGAALRLILTGNPIDAQEALRLGLVDEVVPAADLISRAEALAAAIADNAPLAVKEALAAVDEGLSLPLDLALMREATRFAAVSHTADAAEGTTAFLAKRKAAWTGK